MQTHVSRTNPASVGKLRVRIISLALVILAGSVLLVWLTDHRDVKLVLALAAILVGWLLTLVVAEPREDCAAHKIEGTEAS